MWISRRPTTGGITAVEPDWPPFCQLALWTLDDLSFTLPAEFKAALSTELFISHLVARLLRTRHHLGEIISPMYI